MLSRGGLRWASSVGRPIFAAAGLENRCKLSQAVSASRSLGAGKSYEEATSMAETFVTPETPDVAETVSFLRRFADLMSNGYNAGYLHQASNLLESLAATATTASDEEALWRYKYETLTRQVEAVEAECDSLKSDIEGHLEITSAVMAERDLLAATLQAREAEIAQLRDGLNRERDQRADKTAAHEEALAGLRAEFERKHVALQVTLETRNEEYELLRRNLDRERDESAAKSAADAAELAEQRLAFDRERGEMRAQMSARGDELTLFRMASEREREALKEKIAALEAARANLRSAFDQINHFGIRGIEAGDGTRPGLAVNAGAALAFTPPPSGGVPELAGTETSMLVSTTTLRQARAQFEYLARQFIPAGDIVSQVMCELGAYTIDLALVGGPQTEHLPVGEMARSILGADEANQN